MESNLCHGQIWKGSNAQITVPVFQPFHTALTNDMVVYFYTTPSAQTVAFTQTGGTLSISGNMATVMFQPIQLEMLDDGQLKYVVSYTTSGTSQIYELETRWFLKTPNPYVPIEYATKSWVESQGYLTQHQQLKTINGSAITGSGNIEISGGSGVVYTAGENIKIVNNEISVDCSEPDTKLHDMDAKLIAQETSIINLYSTKQDNLVSGENIKTINHNSVLGSGNLDV